MRADRSTKKPAARRLQDMILFTIGSKRFSIAADAVDEIRNLDGLVPRHSSFVGKLAKVKHILIHEKKNRSTTYFVVDAAMHFQIRGSQPSRVLILSGSRTALLVDSIERMAQIASVHRLPQAFSGEELVWYCGLACLGDQIFPVVHPGSFLNKGELAVLDAERSNAVADEVSA